MLYDELPSSRKLQTIQSNSTLTFGIECRDLEIFLLLYCTVSEFQWLSTIATLSSFDGALNGDGGDVVTRYKAFARFSERMIKQTFFYSFTSCLLWILIDSSTYCEQVQKCKSKTNLARISHVVMLFVGKNINFLSQFYLFWSRNAKLFAKNNLLPSEGLQVLFWFCLKSGTHSRVLWH